MRICLELTSSGSQLALHRTLSKGLTVFCGETRQSSPRRAAAPSPSPRGGPRGPTRTMRRASVASPVLPVNAAGRHSEPQPRVPVHDEQKIRASAIDILASLNKRLFCSQFVSKMKSRTPGPVRGI